MSTKRILKNLQKKYFKSDGTDSEASPPVGAHSSRIESDIKTVENKPSGNWRIKVVYIVVIIIGGWICANILIPSSLQLSIYPKTLKFGRQTVETSATKNITVINSSPEPVIIDNIIISGQHSAEYHISAIGFPKVIYKGRHLDIPIQFLPNAVGGRSAVAEIHLKNEIPSRLVYLEGIGVNTSPAASTSARLYEHIPFVRNVTFVPIIESDTWRNYAAIAVAAATLLILFILYLWSTVYKTSEPMLSWDENKSTRFSMGQIGGNPESWLTDETLNQLDEIFKQSQFESLIILEDKCSESIQFNRTAHELADGMKQRDIPVILASFQGVPDVVATGPENDVSLRQLREENPHSFVLIFSDGGNTEATQVADLKDKWSFSSSIAWMELREPKLWDNHTFYIYENAFPVFPANRTGISQVFRYFCTNESYGYDISAIRKHRNNGFTPAGMNNSVYIEFLLGKAILWAQECAMIQPISPGLADALRREFHPELPPEFIDRLFALPFTTYNSSGLRFDDKTLKLLRKGFIERKMVEEQNNVLQFILHHVETAEPEHTDSLAHLKWYLIRQRICLELYDYFDIMQFSPFYRTPMAVWVHYEIGRFGLPEEPDKIPLRIHPKNKKTYRQLWRLAKTGDINHVKNAPVGGLKWAVIGLLVVIILACSQFSANSYRLQQEALRKTKWAISGSIRPKGRLEIFENDQWSMVASGQINDFNEINLIPDQTYRLLLYDNLLVTEKEIDAPQACNITVEVARQDIVRKCRTEYPDLGLAVWRCPVGNTETDAPEIVKFWRQEVGPLYAGNRMMSIGLEISYQDSPKLNEFRNMLLSTHSIDVLYQIRPDANNQLHLREALEKMIREISPWIERSQMIFWEVDAEPGFVIPSKFFNRFDRFIMIDGSDENVWPENLMGIFEAGPDIIVNEHELISALGATEKTTSGDGVPIKLLRPFGKEESPAEIVKRNKNEFSLTVNTIPKNAQVRIMNIRPRYHDGILLKPGRYEIEISKENYKMITEWIELGKKDLIIERTLEKEEE